jgi:hypothetical protein
MGIKKGKVKITKKPRPLKRHGGGVKKTGGEII